MVLQVGKLGITRIKNTNTGSNRNAISVYKGMELNGGALQQYGTDNCMVAVGYNEDIICDTEDQALNLLILIDGILTVGEPAQDVVSRVEDAVQNLFFQEAS